jgi:hypothetical protein
VDRQVLQIFQFEVELQCKIILVSANELNAALVSGNNIDIWRELQSILMASANLSKMFWGSGGKKEDERKALRESLQVGDDSPLRDPDLRNDFEHFDERLTKWHKTSERKNYFGRSIGKPNVVGVDETEFFQMFDPPTGTVTFWEHSVNLNDVISEVQRLLPLAIEAVRKPRWDPPA